MQLFVFTSKTKDLTKYEVYVLHVQVLFLQNEFIFYIQFMDFNKLQPFSRTYKALKFVDLVASRLQVVSQ